MSPNNIRLKAGKYRPAPEPAEDAREQENTEAILEFARLMQNEYRPQIDELMLNNNACEPGLCADTIAPLLRHAFDAGRAEVCARAHDARILDEAAERIRANRPKIVCLCGSTRFMEQFFDSGWDETMKGNIVLSVGVNLKMETPDGGHVGEALGPEIKEMLDDLHKRKIDLADEILVLNVDGYIGESTRSEIDYAKAHGKPVRYLDESAVRGKE